MIYQDLQVKSWLRTELHCEVYKLGETHEARAYLMKGLNARNKKRRLKNLRRHAAKPSFAAFVKLDGLKWLIVDCSHMTSVEKEPDVLPLGPSWSPPVSHNQCFPAIVSIERNGGIQPQSEVFSANVKMAQQPHMVDDDSQTAGR